MKKLDDPKALPISDLILNLNYRKMLLTIGKFVNNLNLNIQKQQYFK